MLYIIIAEDVAQSLNNRLSSRAAHLSRLKILQKAGKLIIAGPTPTNDTKDNIDFSGSVIIAEFPSLIAAKQWANNDPYVHAGVYKNITVKPFTKIFPQI